jgi:hypothetical protein
MTASFRDWCARGVGLFIISTVPAQKSIAGSQSSGRLAGDGTTQPKLPREIGRQSHERRITSSELVAHFQHRPAQRDHLGGAVLG